MVILEEPIKEVLQLKNYINGEWVKSKSGRSLGVINPGYPENLSQSSYVNQGRSKCGCSSRQAGFP